MSIVDLTVANICVLAPLRVASKKAFATVKSTIDNSNSSNTVLLFLKYQSLFIDTDIIIYTGNVLHVTLTS